MKCFYVLVHGALAWQIEGGENGAEFEVRRPRGFYCHRYVLAKSDSEARSKAFKRVRQNLERQTGWLSAGLAELELEAEETLLAPMYKVLKPDNRGHTFYDGEE